MERKMIPRFRVWDKIHKTMYKADDVKYIDIEKNQIYVETPSPEQLNCYRLRDVDVMHSTGFRDKNGKEIFEGDVLGTEDGLLDGVVEYRTDLGMWTNSLFRYNNFERLCNVADSTYIIGNIYKNPELLEVN